MDIHFPKYIVSSFRSRVWILHTFVFTEFSTGPDSHQACLPLCIPPNFPRVKAHTNNFSPSRREDGKRMKCQREDMDTEEGECFTYLWMKIRI